MKNSFAIFFLVLLSFSSCKKKKTDSINDVQPTQSERIAIDASFGDNGSLLFYNTNYDKLEISNGRMALSGNYSTDMDYSNLCRLNTNGDFISSFGVSGIANYSFPIEGQTFLSNDELFVYGNSGINKIGTDGSNSTISALNPYYFVNTLSDGKLMVEKGDTLIRLNADYTTDLSFAATKGAVVMGFVETNNSYYVLESSTKKIYRVNLNGGFDVSFASNGILTIPDAGDKLQFTFTNGSMYVYQSLPINNTYCIRINKFSLNGNPDFNFGNGGTLIIKPKGLNENYFLPSLVISNSSTIYLFNLFVVPSNNFSISNKAQVMKFNSNGILDTSFGKNGIDEITGMTYTYDAEIIGNNLFLLGMSKSFPNSSLITKFKIE